MIEREKEIDVLGKTKVKKIISVDKKRHTMMTLVNKGKLGFPPKHPCRYIVWMFKYSREAIR